MVILLNIEHLKTDTDTDINFDINLLMAKCTIYPVMSYQSCLSSHSKLIKLPRCSIIKKNAAVHLTFITGTRIKLQSQLFCSINLLKQSCDFLTGLKHPSIHINYSYKHRCATSSFAMLGMSQKHVIPNMAILTFPSKLEQLGYLGHDNIITSCLIITTTFLTYPIACNLLPQMIK